MASELSTKKAIADMRVRDALEKKGLLLSPKIGKVVTNAIRRIVQRGDPVDMVSRQTIDLLTDIYAKMAVAAHAAGYNRVYSRFPRRVEFASLIDEVRSLIVSGAFEEDEEKTGLIYMDEARVAANSIWGDAVRILNSSDQEKMAEIIKSLDLAGIGPEQAYLVDTMIRTQMQIGYSAGKMDALDDPIIQDELWGFEYVATPDDRVRPNHQAMDGMRLAKDDSKLSSITPPNGYNCRCDLIEVWRDETNLTSERWQTEREIDGELVILEPDSGWDFSPASLLSDRQ